MVAVINYGMGNIVSVQKALKKVGMESISTSSADDIQGCSHIILPGVGSFHQAMQNLNSLGLKDILRNEVLANKKPIMGICLGMQLLADKGFEHGETEGLGLIQGSVEEIPALYNFPVPHMGWNEIKIKNSKYFNSNSDTNFYFVHSYQFNVSDPLHVAATVSYGIEITAAVEKDNIFGTQFHPEKSQEEGINVLKSFFSLHA